MPANIKPHSKIALLYSEQIQGNGQFTLEKQNDHLESTQGPHLDEKYALQGTATVHRCNAVFFNELTIQT